MNSLEYSAEALEAKALFYDKKAILYVEGIDDPLFWFNFTNLLDLNVHIEEVGGSDEIEKIVDKIINDDAKVYVALDRDYIDFYEDEFRDRYLNERILLTYGHSIENTLYNPIILNEVIKTYVRKTDFDYISNIEFEFQNFENQVKNLLVVDILSNKLKSSVKVLGDSCMRHLKNSKSCTLCSKKIEDYLNGLGLTYPNNLKKLIERQLNESGKRIAIIIKGHFLTSFVINLIKSYIRRFRDKEITLNLDNLYTSVIDKINIIKNSDEHKFYLKECQKIIY